MGVALGRCGRHVTLLVPTYPPFFCVAKGVSGAILTFCFILLFSIRKWCDSYVSLFHFHSSDVSGATVTVE